jgi:hypothetical protein
MEQHPIHGSAIRLGSALRRTNTNQEITMDMPKPTQDHKRLEKLAGLWRGTEKMYPSQWDPKGGEAQATTSTRVVCAGFAVVCDYEQTRGGQRTFEGHGVYTWDPKKSQVVMHWFDSMGQGVDEFRGTWQGDKLTMTNQGPMGHMRISYTTAKPGVMTSMMETSQDGKAWSKLFEGTYRRED